VAVKSGILPPTLLAVLLTACASPAPPEPPTEPQPPRIQLGSVAAATPVPQQVNFDADSLGLQVQPRLLSAVDPHAVPPDSTVVSRPAALQFALGESDADSLLVTSAGAWSELRRSTGTGEDPIPGLAALFNDRRLPPLEDFDRLPDRDLPGEVLRARAAYVEFNSGIGLRFLSAHAWNLEPLVNGALVYNFIGLTWDGRYVTSLTLHLTTTLLPDEPAPVLDDERAAFAVVAEDYARDLTAALEAAPESAFEPSLHQLDELVRSLTVREPDGG